MSCHAMRTQPQAAIRYAVARRDKDDKDDKDDLQSRVFCCRLKENEDTLGKITSTGGVLCHKPIADVQPMWQRLLFDGMKAISINGSPP